MTEASQWWEESPGEASEVPEKLTFLPMTTPLDPERCPCGRPSRIDGFCEEHVAAVAFRVPITAEGDVLPAVGWHWGHERPCPLGESWRFDTRLVEGVGEVTVWACPHPTH